MEVMKSIKISDTHWAQLQSLKLAWNQKKVDDVVGLLLEREVKN